jgi:hypothetical protein
MNPNDTHQHVFDPHPQAEVMFLNMIIRGQQTEDAINAVNSLSPDAMRNTALFLTELSRWPEETQNEWLSTLTALFRYARAQNPKMAPSHLMLATVFMAQQDPADQGSDRKRKRHEDQHDPIDLQTVQ